MSMLLVLQVGQCSKLGVLSLRDNRILHLPTEIGNLKELHVLDVSGNRSVQRAEGPSSSSGCQVVREKSEKVREKSGNFFHLNC